jgi:hypothetical protein
MRTFISLVVLFAFGGLVPQSATGQSHVLYQDIFIPVGIALQVGIDDGNGFVVSLIADDDLDGVIQLPTVPVGYRVAIGFPETAHEDCLIYTTIGTQVQVGRTFVLPLFERLGGGPLGADFAELTTPTTMLQPNDIFTSSGGVFPGWPAVRWLDTTGVPNFPTFLEQVSTLPGYTGGIQITDSLIRFRVVPEPSVWSGIATGVLLLATLVRTKR